MESSAVDPDHAGIPSWIRIQQGFEAGLFWGGSGSGNFVSEAGSGSW